MSEAVRHHYENHPYPHYPLLASVRACDTYALNLSALWGKFNSIVPPEKFKRILLAGCGSFSPYPFSIANNEAKITALDLSAGSLRRARLHCLLHGCCNLRYQTGDLLDRSVAVGPFGLIDAFGVLHHLDDPLDGFRALEERLAPGGIVRIMVYHRYARREEESIRRAVRLLGIRDTVSLKALIRRASSGSRLKSYCDSSVEASFDSGLADALLHPCVRTFRIDELLELIAATGLELLQFAHYGACEHAGDEVDRIRLLEQRRESCGNILLYLRKTAVPITGADDSACIVLNPCLRGAVSPLRFGTLRIPPRLGFDNPLLGWRERRFLNTFRSPIPVRAIEAEMRAKVTVYKKSLFLIECKF